MKKRIVTVILFALACAGAWAQELPSWVRMGMPLAEIRRNARGTLTGPEENNFYSYRIDSKIHGFTVGDNGLEAFAIGQLFGFNAELSTLTKSYGEPVKNPAGYYRFFEKLPKDVGMIVLSPLEQTAGFTLGYYFSNSTDLATDKLMASLYSVQGRSNESVDTAKAIEWYTNGIDRDPTYPDNWYGRGRAYYAQGDLNQAASDLRRALRVWPDDEQAAEARTTLAAITAAQEEQAAGYIAEGNSALDQGRYDDAVTAYNAALKIAPDSSKAKAGLDKARQGRAGQYIAEGDSALDRGRYDAAITAYNAALNITPGNAEAKAGLAKAKRGKENALKASFAWNFGGYFQGWHQNLGSAGLGLQLGIGLDAMGLGLNLLGDAGAGVGYPNLIEYNLGGMAELYFFRRKFGIGAGGGLYRNMFYDEIGTGNSALLEYPLDVSTGYTRFTIILPRAKNTRVVFYADLYGDITWGFGIQIKMK